MSGGDGDDDDDDNRDSSGLVVINQNPGEYPISINEEGIKINKDRMEQEKLYYCFYEDKAYLFFKDDFESLNCYEIEDPAVVAEVKADPAKMEQVLKKRAGM